MGPWIRIVVLAFSTGAKPGLFCLFSPFLNTMTNIVQTLTIKAQMVCLGFEPGAAGL